MFKDKKTISATVLVALILSAQSSKIISEDFYVKAQYPLYDIVIGKDVKFDWDVTTTVRDQDSFQVITDQGVKGIINSKNTHYNWIDFPFGTSWWNVRVYNRTSGRGEIGRTSQQNFYHYNNVTGRENPKYKAFEYRRGFRDLTQTRDLTIFYEFTKDYTVNLNWYFADLDKLPGPYVKWDKTEAQHKILKDYIRTLNFKQKDGSPDRREWEFLEMDNGIFTVKKGYRWDGTSNPFVWEEHDHDLRASAVHDALYDTMRMKLLDHDNDAYGWNDKGWRNRLIADMMWYMISVEDGYVDLAQSDFETLRFGGFGKTHNDKLLLPWKYHISGLTAWASDGMVRLYLVPADLHEKDPHNYSSEDHIYQVWKAEADFREWEKLGEPFTIPSGHNPSMDPITLDQDVQNDKIYYYWLRGFRHESWNKLHTYDQDSDKDGWTDQEENEYGGGYINRPALHPPYKERHYDESSVEGVVPTAGGPRARFLTLDGDDDYVEANTVSSDLDGNGITIEAWVYPDTQVEDSAWVFWLGHRMALKYDEVNRQFCIYGTFSGNYACSESITPFNWYHVAVTMDENGVGRLQVNGEQKGDPIESRLPQKGVHFFIGAEVHYHPHTGSVLSTHGHFKGRIDEVRVWSKVRTPDEIALSMDSAMQGYNAGLAGHWHFDEPDGIYTAYDASIYSNDGNVRGQWNNTDPCADIVVDIQVHDIAVPLDETGNASITWTNLVSETDDMRCIEQITVSPNTFTCEDIGENQVTLTVTHVNGDETTSYATVTVVDTTAPSLSVSLSPNTLWPPNHKMTPIEATVQTSDACDGNPDVKLVSIISNQADNKAGDGNTIADIQGADYGADDRVFQLRAERAGKNSDRIYTVTYVASDASGNTSENAMSVVTVPHNMAKQRK